MSYQSDLQQKKLSQLSNSINQLNTIISRDRQILTLLDQTTAEQTSKNITQLTTLIYKNQQNISQLLPQLQLFEQEVAFLDEQPPLPEQIINDKTGFIQNSVIEQIQRIDANQHQNNPVRYKELNKQLSNKLCKINKEMQTCIAYADKKL